MCENVKGETEKLGGKWQQKQKRRKNKQNKCDNFRS